MPWPSHQSKAFIRFNCGFHFVSQGIQLPRLQIRETDVYARWFASLRDRRAKVRILARVRRLSLGNPGIVEPVGGGVSELKIDYGPGYRVYVTRSAAEEMTLLIGGDKRTQARDIERAKTLARELPQTS